MIILQEPRFEEHPELPWLDVLLLTEYGKYQTNTLHNYTGFHVSWH